MVGGENNQTRHHIIYEVLRSICLDLAVLIPWETGNTASAVHPFCHSDFD